MKLFQDKRFFSHAFANPLTNLTLNIEQALQKSHNKEVKAYLNRALKSSQYLQDILKSIQASQIIKANWINLKEVINDGVSCFKQTKTDANLIIKIKALESHQIKAIKIEFQEALVCILNNAYESYGPTDKKNIELHVRAIHNKCFIAVQDFGCGINLIRKILLKIAPMSTKAKYRGAGLLFAKKVFKKKLKGKFEIKSKKNKGTVVIISIFAIDS